jgi:hypothetical protein
LAPSSGAGLAQRLWQSYFHRFSVLRWALLLVLITSWMFVKASPHFADQVFRKCQLVSAALYSLGHGSNDAQKTMGIIAVLLYS